MRRARRIRPAAPLAAPENGTYLSGFGQRVQQATWTSPITNKLLLEAGFGTYWSQWGGTPHPGSNFTQLVGMTEQCTAGCAANGSIANLAYRSGTYRQNFQARSAGADRRRMSPARTA